MGIMVIPEHRITKNDLNALLASGPTNLVEELVLYRQKSEHLGRLHELHRCLCEKLDLASMVEAISIWLSHYCSHELVGYGHPGQQRQHAACSRHGPERKKFIEAAYRLLSDRPQQEGAGELEEGFQYRLFPLTKGQDHLLVIHQTGPGSHEELNRSMAEVMEELRGPLDRALAYEALYDQARRDSLTGLSNRRVFEETASREIAHAQRYNLPLTIAALDLDHFKAVNDFLGHGAGDQVLQRVARVLQETVRNTDHLSRVGGDEFILLMPNTREEDASRLCQRLCQAVNQLHIQAPGAPPLGVSIGLCRWCLGEEMVDWLERADAALYRAKSQGRGQTVVQKGGC